MKKYNNENKHSINKLTQHIKINPMHTFDRERTPCKSMAIQALMEVVRSQNAENDNKFTINTNEI